MSDTFLKISIVFVLGLWGMLCPFSAIYAENVPVETFHEEFRVNTGKEWIEATAEEKRSFVQGYYQAKEEAIRKGKERSYDGSSASGGRVSLNIESTLEIRTLFEKRNKKSWKEASFEEQKAFLEEYAKAKEEERQRQKREEEKKAREEEKRIRDKEREKERLKRLEEKKKQDALKEKERREKEREKSREKLEDALEKLEKKRSSVQNERR